MKITKKMGKTVLVSLLAAALFIAPATNVYATETQTNLPKPLKTVAYLKSDVTVTVAGETYSFYDANGGIVYPLNYNGTTYLPVRAVSSIMKEDIEWDNYSKTIFIGKTLSNPNKSKVKAENDFQYAKPAEGQSAMGTASLITVIINPNITVMYDFEVKTFKDANEKIVYPIIYNGTTYLPIRAISGLMGKDIEWDNNTKTVAIGHPEDEEVVEKPEVSADTEYLIEFFEDQVELYDNATAKVSGLNAITDPEELQILAKAVSEDFRKAEDRTFQIKIYDTSQMTEAELDAYNKMAEFTEISEYYILIIENITCMAATNSDYSVLAETFYNFAMKSSALLDEARKAVDALEL